MDERLLFVARRLDGDKMAALCREFDISRKTGYKIFNRYKNSGLEGLTDRSRRPYRQANQLPMQIEKLIVRLKERSQLGERRRSARGSDGAIPVCARPRSAPSMRCWIATGSSSVVDAAATRPRAPLCRRPTVPTSCGAPTTRANSCSPIVAIAIRSRSATSKIGRAHV